MDFPVIAAVTASGLALLQIFLGFLVGFALFKHKIGIGDGGNENLARKIRVHGNLTENAPLFLILLTMLELSGTNEMLLIGYGAVFILARIAHAYALSQTVNPLTPLRALGAMGTNLSIITAVGLILHQVFA